MLLVTGVNGGLGALVLERLAGREGVVAGSRTPQRVPAGVPARLVDFDRPRTLAEAFTGVRTLLLISAGAAEDDVVIARHGAAIGAAERAGVDHVVYTSLSGDGDHLPYALAHRWTERRLRASATLRWTVLRNGLYAEFLGAIAAPGPDGVISAPLGDGRLAAVARADLAEAAVNVALAPAGHAGRTYELVGERAVGGAEVAEALGAAYRPGRLTDARAAVAASDARDFQVPMVVGTYSAIAHGFLAGPGGPGDLAALLGRAPRPALEVIAEGR
ncbi:NmrA family transcriptional regulator [Kitasatospora xanthocidica]|uniref:NmrA family transcriptional regulator n=2 Tax=Kitasatospora TaxID=2063 RepID=A0A372ZQ95_9ACTN|nr:NAD(P)H-binding protein [Kitasatospora xanthocidica]RGD57911.1 NmrA family transcriptional regulator [Kitasatospora xanthocidica]